MPKKRSDDMPATFGALNHFRAELKSDISRLEHKMDARFKDVDARFKGIDARFDQVDARFDLMDAKLDKMNARIDEINAKTERTLAIAEQKQVELTKLMDAHLLTVKKLYSHERRMDNYDENMAVMIKYIKEKN